MKCFHYATIPTFFGNVDSMHQCLYLDLVTFENLFWCIPKLYCTSTKRNFTCNILFAEVNLNDLQVHQGRPDHRVSKVVGDPPESLAPLENPEGRESRALRDKGEIQENKGREVCDAFMQEYDVETNLKQLANNCSTFCACNIELLKSMDYNIYNFVRLMITKAEKGNLVFCDSK